MAESSNTPKNLDSNITSKNTFVLPKSVDQKIDAKISEKKSAELKVINNQTLDELFKFQYGMIESEISSINDTDAGKKLEDNFNLFKGKFDNTLQTLKMGADMQKEGYEIQDMNYDKRNLELKQQGWQILIDFQTQVENLKSIFPNQSEKILKTLGMLKKNFSKRYDFDTKNTQDTKNFPTQNINAISGALNGLDGGILEDQNVSNLVDESNKLEADLKKMPGDILSARKTISALISEYNKKTFDFMPAVAKTLKENLPAVIKFYNSKSPNKIPELHN